MMALMKLNKIGDIASPSCNKKGCSPHQQGLAASYEETNACFFVPDRKSIPCNAQMFPLVQPKQVEGTTFPLSSDVQLAILVVLRKLVDKVAKQH